MVGNNSYTERMTFSFADPVTSVGALMNYYPDEGASLEISAYDSLNNLLETYSASFLTGSGENQGKFLGFSTRTRTLAPSSSPARSSPLANSRSMASTPAQSPSPRNLAVSSCSGRGSSVPSGPCAAACARPKPPPFSHH
jgi:hypothetical protein